MSGTVDFESLQNTDGGWGYRGGGSWTEPTCYALAALGAAGLSASQSCQRGAHWLRSRQRSDGGWSPRDGVAESTWVTALALLLANAMLPRSQQDHAAAWILAQTGRETSFVFRLRMRLLNVRLEGTEFEGWPWYPGAAAWVAPTTLSILAMEKHSKQTGSGPWRDRIEQGRRFLLARRCRDGGWNHGSSKALGYDSGSYPETTGMALLALHDSRAPEMSSAEALAMRQLIDCPSSEAASWLRLGLLARGKKVDAKAPVPRGTMDLALSSLADAAAQGRNVFLA
jgi:hypothetical protein